MQAKPISPQNPRPRVGGLSTHSSLVKGMTTHGRRLKLHGGLGFLHSITQEDRIYDEKGNPGRARSLDMTVCRVGLQESLFFLLFFRKEGVRNFFFFLDGDLPGDPSLPASIGDPSSVAGEATSSAPGAEAEAGSGSASARG